jgi:molybdopterin converting factor small subunit
MRITVKYMAQLKRLAGASEVIEVGSGSVLGAVLVELAARHGADFRALLLGADGQPQRSLLVFIGDERAGLNQELHDGDRVTILSPMAGG